MAQTRAEKSKQKILDACQSLILQKGFASTSVDDICKTAGMTKGGFFYHFASKDEAGQAAMEHWTDMGTTMMCSAPGETAVERLFNCIDMMIQGALSTEPQPGCVVGTISQEAAPMNDALAAMTGESLTRGVGVTTQMITDAANELGIKPDPADEFEQLSLAMHASFQGSFVIARGRRDHSVIPVVAQQFRKSLRARFGLDDT